MEPRYVLGVDIGTSSVRALVYDRRLSSVDGLESQIPYAPNVQLDGSVTIAPDELVTKVFEVLDEVTASLTTAGQSVDLVGISCFWHSLLLLDDANRPIAPVSLWADTRPASTMAAFAQTVDGSRLSEATGARPHPSYWPAKLFWYTQTDPAALGRAVRVVSAAEYLWWRLFGEFRVGVSMASGTGLLNISTCKWDDYACSLLPSKLVEGLSPVGDEDTSILAPSFRKRWPAMATARWSLPVGDGACSSIGAGGWSADRVVMTVGTSSAVRVVIPDASAHKRRAERATRGLWVYRVDSARLIIGGALSEGGNLIAWLQSCLGLGDIDAAEKLIRDYPAGRGALTLLPFIAGERSPGWHAGAKAVLLGLNLSTTPLDILQAGMESIAYQLQTILDQLIAGSGEPHMIIASGGALYRSDLWTQIIANVCDRSLVGSAVAETASRGAAALALEAAGVIDLGDLELDLGRTFRPTDTAAYSAGRQRQQRLYKALVSNRPEA
ncbi:MAG TPA: gluconokinase [Chloroflexota bacterium]|jgi:gluconokinase|nr:gluconokinase [Chloroflexota bacterium]